jgi:hypothetical protein
MRLRRIAGAILASLAVGACASPAVPTPTVTTPSPSAIAATPTSSPTPAPSPVAGGCGLTQVYSGPGPDARLGLWDNPWAWATPADSGVVAYFWYPPPGILSVRDPSVSNSGDTKVLWVFRDPGPGPAGPLTINAHPLGQTSPVVAVQLSNGDKGVPSSVELPTPGCWRLEIAAGPAHATMDVMVAALPSAPSPSSEAFRVSGDEAAAISTVERFIESINAGDLGAATSLVAADATGSDCDYAHGAVTVFNGRPSVIGWLAGLIAGHDRFAIGHIYSESDAFTPVVGVEFANRSGDLLTRLGYPGGVVPSEDAKVILTSDMSRIRGFALGPGGADPGTIASVCSPA